MLKRIVMLAVFIVLCFHTSAFAHGGGLHIMGTVTDMDAQHVVVKTKDGKTQAVQVNDHTTYRKGTATATSADLQVGDRVAVHTTGKGDPLTAKEIHFSSASKATGQAKMNHSSAKP
jgi:ribosomal protein S1